MRTIKFKAQRVSDGEWVESPSIQNNPFGKIYLMDTKRLVECYNKEVMPSNIWIEIDPNTLCQFTGLTDRNGKEIYEGDIIKVSAPFIDIIGKISWSNGNLCYMILFVDGESEPLYGWHSKEVEVIGNIHNK